MKANHSSQSPDFLLNNRPVSICDIPAQTTLLDYIRAQGLTGAKEGCAEGECGACTVVLVADRAGQSEYRAINSCLMLASMAAGHEIYTVEALAAGGKLAEVQQAMAAGGGSQCGYCTPGFVMSMFAEQYRPSRIGPCDLHELGGNLCRCTGYRPIRDAALSLGPAPSGDFLDRLSRPAPSLEAVEHESAGVRFSRPTSIEDCLSILVADPDARLISGGTDLVVESNLRSRRWKHLVSVEAIAELREFSESLDAITIGAALPLNEIVKRWNNPPEVFLARYSAGFAKNGRLEGVRVSLYSDGGWSLDLSEPVLSRALFHCDNAYLLPAAELTGLICRTHKTSQTAFRGFGGPQGMLVIEEILDRAARRLGLPPDVIRERNFYREGDTTHYGQPVKDAGRMEVIWRQLKESAAFARRRAEMECWNANHPNFRRGLAITPVRFGISFTATFFNQGAALVLIYRDGSVQVNHGGAEMGQGLHTKIQQIAAESLGLDLDAVRVMPTSTGKIPNTSATAASAGTDLNGAAVANGCCELRGRLAEVAGVLLDCDFQAVRFLHGMVFPKGEEHRAISFAQVCEAAYRQRIPLFAQGYYRTPDIHYDPHIGRGQPFHYFAYAAAVSEVEVDAFTGDYRLLRTDILEDVGDSVSPLVDRGQIEGGFIQGVGWLTLEELVWDAKGRLATAGASTYKLPSWTEVPDVFNVDFLERAAEPGTIFGSKAVGEPPLMLAISVREEIRDAIAAFGAGGPILLESPATPERVFFAVQRARAERASQIIPVGATQ